MDLQLQDALSRWRGADLLTDEQADRIRAFEAERTDVVPAPATAPAGEADAGPLDVLPTPEGRGARLIAEGLAYVGAALAVGAGLLVFGDLWDELGALGHTLLSLLATAVLAAGAVALREHEDGPLGRLCTLLAALAALFVGISVGVALAEFTDADADVVGLTAGAAGLLAAVPAHRWRPSWPTTLVLGAGVLTTIFAGEAVLDIVDSVEIAGVTLLAVALAWASLGWSGHLRPRTAFEVTGLLAGGVGVQMLAFEAFAVGALVVGLVVAGGALAVGLTEERTAPAVLGGLGITVFAPQLVLEVAGDTIGGPLALFVGGVTLVVVAVTIIRQRALT